MKLSTNEVTLIGFVGGDAKQKETKNHSRYAVVNMATNESWKDKQTGEWTKRSTWHRLVGYGTTGESMMNLAKGAFVQVRGSIRNYELPGKDGQGKRNVTEIVVTGFAKLDRNRQPVPEEAAA